MVLRTQLQVSSGAEERGEGDPRVEVASADEAVAPANRVRRGRPPNRQEYRLPVWGERVVFAGIAAVALIGLIGAMWFASLYGAALVRIGDVTAGADAQRRLNESCQNELSFTRGELSRVDRLIGYARGGGK